MNLSNQSKSFIFLVIVAIVGTYVCILLWGNINYKSPVAPLISPYSYGNVKQNQANPEPTPTPVDTSNWTTYTNEDLNIKFKHPSTWKVQKPVTKQGFTILQIDPGSKYYNLKIYVNPNSFYIMDGLPTSEENINGKTALNVNNALYGIKTDSSYYTFDVGLSMSLLPEFNALVHSVEISQ